MDKTLRERYEEITKRWYTMTAASVSADDRQTLVKMLSAETILPGECATSDGRVRANKLPRTIDGLAIFPGMTMYFPSRVEATVLAVWFDGTLDMQSHENGIPVNNWKRLQADSFGYSTKEAAEAARRTRQ